MNLWPRRKPIIRALACSCGFEHDGTAVSDRVARAYYDGVEGHVASTDFKWLHDHDLPLTSHAYLSGRLRTIENRLEEIQIEQDNLITLLESFLG